MNHEHRPLVAVTSDQNPNFLKRHALLFDQFLLIAPSLHRRRVSTVGEEILAEKLGVHLAVLSAEDPPTPEEVELDWLRERGVVIEGPRKGFPRDVLAKTGHLERLQAAVRENRLVQGRDAERTLDLFLSLFTRGAAASLRDDNIDALAIADSVDRFQLPADTSDHVTAVVIQNLPIPNDTTSWDDVLDFKSDTRVRMFHSLLRKWIWQHAKGALSLRELAGEIEAETARFEAFMERHRDNVLLGFAKDPDSLLDQS